MDKKLHPYKEYARCYVDDIVIFSRTFEEHIQHLHAVLRDLAETNMTLASTKCYIGYHSIELLGHVVDRFGLSTIKQKTDVIVALPFPQDLMRTRLLPRPCWVLQVLHRTVRIQGQLLK